MGQRKQVNLRSRFAVALGLLPALAGCMGERYLADEQKWIGQEKQKWIAHYEGVSRELLPEYEAIGAQMPSDEDVYRQAVERSGLQLGPRRSGATGLNVLGEDGVPADYRPWWESLVTNPINPNSNPSFENVEKLYLRALKHSTQIKVFEDIPLIRETAILEAEGDFDPRLFSETRFRRTNEPVGSTLQTGGPSRFKEKDFRFTGGVRKRLITGGDVELSQRIGTVDNNSVFFVPKDQGQTRLSLSFTQPLLRGAGIGYNLSTIEIAKIDSSISQDEFQRQVESHLVEISRAYWTLYFERASLLIKQRLVQEAQTLAQELEGRRGVDALESEIARSQAALGERRAEVIRASLAVRNAEAKIVSLINDPEMRLTERFELVPKVSPAIADRGISARQAAIQALESRPEIDQAFKQLRAGMIRARVSEEELLPVLDAFAELGLDGLEGQDRVGRAFENQFDDGGPSYAVGLRLDAPLGNRTAKARYQRRRLEVRQLSNQMRTTVETLLLEVQVSVNEVNTAKRELGANFQSMLASQAEVDALLDRRQLAVGGDSRASIYVDRLLDAQERLGDEEQDFLAAQLTYNIALTNLDRAMGVLLVAQEIRSTTIRPDNALPFTDLQKE